MLVICLQWIDLQGGLMDQSVSFERSLMGIICAVLLQVWVIQIYFLRLRGPFHRIKEVLTILVIDLESFLITWRTYGVWRRGIILLIINSFAAIGIVSFHKVFWRHNYPICLSRYERIMWFHLLRLGSVLIERASLNTAVVFCNEIVKLNFTISLDLIFDRRYVTKVRELNLLSIGRLSFTCWDALHMLVLLVQRYLNILW